jgi:hypothetical protein
VVWDWYGFSSPAACSYEERMIMMAEIIRILMAGIIMVRCMALVVMKTE